MKSLNLLINIHLLFLTTLGSAQVKVTEINEHTTQLDFGYHLLAMRFNIRPFNDGYENITAGISISPEQRAGYINLVKEEISKLPPKFVTRYLVDNVYVLAITVSGVTGYHSANVVVIDGRQPESRMRNSLLHEITHEMIDKSEHLDEFKSLVNYLDHYRNSSQQYANSSLDIFDRGYCSRYAMSSAEEEICELFAYLMMPDADSDVMGYVSKHRDSVLAKKVDKLIKFLSVLTVSEMNYSYFEQLRSMAIKRVGDADESTARLN